MINLNLFFSSSSLPKARLFGRAIQWQWIKQMCGRLKACVNIHKALVEIQQRQMMRNLGGSAFSSSMVKLVGM